MRKWKGSSRPGRGPFTTAVTTALDDAFVARGFLAGQGQDTAGARSDVIYCISTDAFAVRWPTVFGSLDRHHGGQLLAAGHCIDCTIGGTSDAGITRFDLEAVPPRELNDVGDPTLLHGFTTRALDDQLTMIRRWIEGALSGSNGG